MTYYTTTFPSPLGLITLAGDDDCLVGLWLEGQKYYGATLDLSGSAVLNRPLPPVLSDTTKWLASYFAGEKPDISELTLAPIGSEFRQGVWAILREIPYGQTVTYGYIAKRMAVNMG